MNERLADPAWMRLFANHANNGTDESKRRDGALVELAVAGFALLSLVAAQLMLSAAIHGTTYRGPDGAMVQTSVLTALKFGGHFNVTNINPLQGLGSQLFPKNTWANPAFWPFAFLDRETAADLSPVIALACFALACYVMARCFDLGAVPSALAAQLCIVLFAPAVLIIGLPRNFSPTPADAVTYAPYMIALGLLVRLQPGCRRRFVPVTIGLTACLLYSIYCDPVFTMIPAVSWAVTFAIVAVFPLRLGTVAIRSAALAWCLGALIVSGPAVYLYTLSQYSARVQFAETVDRVRALDQASALYFSEDLHLFYLAFAVGLLAGLLTARGRVRTLVVGAAVSWCFYLGYAVVYLLLLDAAWVLPQPIYVEQCLFVLFMTGAVAGGWALLQWARSVSLRVARNVFTRASDSPRRRSRLAAGFAFALSIAALAVVPAKAAHFATRDARPFAQTFYWPWADEPELVQFFSDRMALTVGGSFRGSVNFLEGNEDGTIEDLRSRGVPTANEYSQTATAPSLYFVHALLKTKVIPLNRFEFYWRNGSYSPNYWAVAQLLGVRYTAERWPLPRQFNPGLLPLTMPYHVPKQPEPEPPGLWYVYELPRPNLGDYSPTEVRMARSGAEIMASLSQPGFDFARQVVLTSPVDTLLVPAQDMRLSVIRNGLHLSGRSDGTSLIVLPQQFSHCLRAREPDVRLVRANLLLTGVIFSGRVDTDITFEYGIFSPWCRLDDLADVKSLDLKINLRRAHLGGGRLFPDWPDALARLNAAARALPFFR